MVVFKEDHRSKFKHLYNNPNYSDFTIVFVNLKKKIFVWKGILSVHSEFFDRLFNPYEEEDVEQVERDEEFVEVVASQSDANLSTERSVTESSFVQNDEWIVNDLIEEEPLLQLIEFFYMGEISFSTEQSINLLLISQKYLVKGGLIESIQIDIETNIKPSNCFTVFKLILSLSVQDSFIDRMLQTCVLEMSKNFEAILLTNQEELLNFSPLTLITFLKAATKIKYGLRCDGKKLLRFIIDWLMRDIETRKEYMPEIKGIESQITYQYKY